MSPLAVGFRGAYIGAAALALAGAFVFMRSARRGALAGALAVVSSTVYALVFLGWVPFVAAGAALERLQGGTAIAAAAVLQILLFTLLGTFRKPQAVRRVHGEVGVVTVLVFV